jgi:hypothetical protein
MVAISPCSPHGAVTQRAFVVLRHLAYDFGLHNQWGDAECVLLALVVRCEQYLPLYHPTTLTSLLDLAIAASMVEKTAFAERAVSRAAKRLSAYLSEMAHNYLCHVFMCMSLCKLGDTVFRSGPLSCFAILHTTLASTINGVTPSGSCKLLIVRCEQYLPLYHPTTLTSLLDLAIAASMVEKTAFAERVVLQTAERLSSYMSEMEHNYLFHVLMCMYVGKLGDTIFRIEYGRDGIYMPHAFFLIFKATLVTWVCLESLGVGIRHDRSRMDK